MESIFQSGLFQEEKRMIDIDKQSSTHLNPCGNDMDEEELSF